MPRCFRSASCLAAALLASIGSSGCSSWRVVLEPVPPPDTIEERVVLETDTTAHAATKVVLIDVDGLIADAPGGLLGRGPNPVAELARSLERASKDDDVRAVVLRINSRGGTVTGSDMVHREVTRFREESGKPVVALLGEVAASGGYYLACAGDEIIAHPTSVTGSIGVIMQTVQVGAALERLGVVADAVVSGPNKAIASPFGHPDPEHRAILQGMVDDFHARFREVVRAGRPDLPSDRFDELTDGRVFTGRQALDEGLVDALGDARDAFDRARDLAGVRSARLVRYHAPGARSTGVYADGRATAGGGTAPSTASGVEINLLRVDGLDGAFIPSTRFLYVWPSPGV